MKRWRCEGCAGRGVPHEWENFLTSSFCEVCGEQGTRIVEFGCFQCREEGVKFFAVHASSHPCPECGSDAYRIVYAPAVLGHERKSDYAAADEALTRELESQRISTTSLKRESRQRQPVDNPFAARWAPANELLPAGGGGVGGKLPYGMPRPVTEIIGRDSRPATAA